MPLGSGTETGKRLSEINWTCDKDCWCHIPVRGQTQPPCYQCVLVQCSLSYKDDFAPSAPRLPPEDYSYEEAFEAQISGAVGGLDSSQSSLATTRRNEQQTPVITPRSSLNFTTNDNTAGGTVFPTPMVRSVRSKRGGSSRNSRTSQEFSESPLLSSSDPLVSELESSNNYTSPQLPIYNEHAGDGEIPDHNTFSDDAQKDDESTVSDIADSEETEGYAASSEHESVAPMLDTQVSRNSRINDTEESTAGLVDSTGETQNPGDLSSRLRMLILQSEEEQELLDPQGKPPMASPERPTANWTVNSKGWTVCVCGDAHRCYSRRRPVNHTVRRHQVSPVVLHRPRLSTSHEARSRTSHTHHGMLSSHQPHRQRHNISGDIRNRPSHTNHSLSASHQPHRQRYGISGEVRNRSFHPHGHLTERDLEFRRINRINRRLPATRASTRNTNLS